MEIEKIKKANTKIIGKSIEYYEKIDSTNTYAETLAKSSNLNMNLPKNQNNKGLNNINEDINGKIIIAEMQTEGQGTKGRKWFTGKKNNIAMSIILKPNCNIEALQGITIKIAELIQKAIYDLYKINLIIKEPNDLLLNGKKICGILTKVNSIGTKVNYIIIGIGMNVNEEIFDEEIQITATSLKKEYKKEFCREDIIIRIIELLDKEIEL